MKLLLAITFIGLFVIVFMSITGVVGAMMTGNKVKADDNKPEVRYRGRVLEKKTEVYDPGSVGVKIKMDIEWVTFEDDRGDRKKLRNIRTKEIMLTPGDVGMVTVRGETIYAFDREW